MKQWILVTGASSGIGRAVATELSKNYNLVLNGRDECRLNETAAACTKDCETRVWKYDLVEVEGIPAAIAKFLSDNDLKISGLVHSAGVSKLMPVGVTRLDAVQETFRVNTVAPFLIAQALVSKRVNSEALKSVVFISSAIADRGAKGYAIYGASKAAIDGLMRGLAVELAPKVRVNSVAPGPVRTPMTESVLANPEVIKRIESRFPLGIGEPGSVADAVSFLLSDRSAWVNGQRLVVDGGISVDMSL